MIQYCIINPSKERQEPKMATVKKSLTVNELADLIRKSPAKSAKEIMKELRTKYTFSKDKWNAARKLITSGKVEYPVTPTKKPAKVTATIACVCDDCMEQAEDELFDIIEGAREDAEDCVGNFFASLKAMSLKNPKTILVPADCPAARPEIFRLLDLAVEGGLLEKHIGYSLSHAALKEYERQSKKVSKKTAKEK